MIGGLLDVCVGSLPAVAHSIELFPLTTPNFQVQVAPSAEPEPGTWALFGVGLLGLAGRRWRAGRNRRGVFHRGDR